MHISLYIVIAIHLFAAHGVLALVGLSSSKVMNAAGRALPFLPSFITDIIGGFLVGVIYVALALFLLTALAGALVALKESGGAA